MTYEYFSNNSYLNLSNYHKQTKINDTTPADPMNENIASKTFGKESTVFEIISNALEYILNGPQPFDGGILFNEKKKTKLRKDS